MKIGFYAFIIIMTTCFLIMRANTISSRRRAKEEKSFWDREQKANFARRQDISTLDYIKIPLDTLPISELFKLGMSKYADELKRLSCEKIINLSSYTNTDLKMMYGPANLDELTIYDSNFTLLIRTLDSIGGELISQASNGSDAADKETGELNRLAVTFLEYAVSINTDITSTYVTLGNIYNSQKETDKLDRLVKCAEKIESLSGPIIVAKLNTIISNR